MSHAKDVFMSFYEEKVLCAKGHCPKCNLLLDIFAINKNKELMALARGKPIPGKCKCGQELILRDSRIVVGRFNASKK